MIVIMNRNLMPWETKSSKNILYTPYVSVNSDTVILPDGSVISDFYTVTIQDAALIVAITDDLQILLAREYRYACKEVSTECPAGMVEDNEDPLETAMRELLEETGYKSGSWTYLGPTFESTSKLTNVMHLFLAEDCVKVSEQDLDDHESIEVLKLPFKDAVQMVMDGKIKANSSAHAILKVWAMRNM